MYKLILFHPFMTRVGPESARAEPARSRVYQTWVKVNRNLFNPPPSNLVFYLLVASNLWFAWQVEAQSTIIKNQMILIDYFSRLVFQR